MKTIANTMSVLSAVQPTAAQSASRSMRFTKLLLLLAFTAGAVGQSTKQAPLTPTPQSVVSTGALPATPQSTATLDAADIGAFLDGLMPLTLERDDIAGAVVAIVKDGKVIFAKGYGYADVKAKKPMSATDTLVRPGSTSKLFTWTAVMQQVQDGKLDLDRDVNDYLDFKIPAKFDKPITLRDIMTHSAGFGETAKDLIVPNAEDLTPLRTYLVTHMPDRIYPPGTTPAYSNYATALAGYIVQRVSGKPFVEYIADNIFGPLQMTRSTFAQPLPNAWTGAMSKGYIVASKDPKPYEIVQPFPAGSLATTAMDMTHFMIAQLQGGSYEGVQILKPETVELMHTRQRAPGNSAVLNAMALGFYEETWNGHRILGHAGDTNAFHSDLHLVPDVNLGFFVSFNSPGKGMLSDRTALWQKFLDRYFPYQLAAAPAIASAADDAGKVAGQYLASRRSQGNFLSALYMAGETDVSANPDHTINVAALHGYNGEPMKFVEIAPLVYRNVDGQEKLNFYQGYDGRMTFGIDFPFMVFQKVGLLDSKSFNVLLVVFSLVVIALTVLFWALAGMVRRHYGRPLAQSLMDRRLRLIVRLTCVAYLVIIAGLALVLSKFGDFATPSATLDRWLVLLQILGVCAVIGSLLAVYYAVRVWRTTAIDSHLGTRRVARATSASGESETIAYVGPEATTQAAIAPNRWIWGRLAWTVVALGCLCFAWLLIHWDVLNFNLHY